MDLFLSKILWFAENLKQSSTNLVALNNGWNIFMLFKKVHLKQCQMLFVKIWQNIQ